MPNIEIPNELTGLFHMYNDKLLADDGLSDVDVLMLSLYFLESDGKKAGRTQEDIKKLFLSLGRKENNFNVALHRAKAQNFLEANNKMLYFLTKGLKKVWELTGNKGKKRVYILKEGQQFTAIKLFEGFINTEMEGEEILLCDPFIDATTLYPFTSLKGKCKSLKILTSNIHDFEKLREYVKKFEKELNCKVEIKKITKCHDRWIISNDSCWSIGGSLKDLGNKDTIITDIRTVNDSLTDLFKERWGEAEKIL